MSYQNLFLNGTTTTLMVKKSMYDEVKSSIENLIVLYKLLEYRVDVSAGGTRLLKISFHKDSSDNFQIQLKKIQGKLNSIDVYFPSIYKDSLMKLFGKDMDVVVDCSGYNIKVFSYIDTGMLNILKKIGSI